MAKPRRLTSSERRVFAEKVMEWGNLVFAGLVVAQVVPGTDPFRISIFAVGSVGIVGAYLSAYFLMTGGE